MQLILYSPGIWVTHTIFYPRSAHSDTPRDSGSPGLHCSHSTLWYWFIRRQVAQWLFQEQARLAYHDTGNLYWQTPSMRLSSRGCLLKGIPFLPLKECTRHTDNVLGNAWSCTSAFVCSGFLIGVCEHSQPHEDDPTDLHTTFGSRARTAPEAPSATSLLPSRSWSG